MDWQLIPQKSCMKQEQLRSMICPNGKRIVQVLVAEDSGAVLDKQSLKPPLFALKAASVSIESTCKLVESGLRRQASAQTLSSKP
eukprot:1156014-Pelagomonas_calceolata.AAC.12